MSILNAPSLSFMLSCAVIIALLSPPVAAFGAGNIASISAIEGQNWRHGDIEDTLLNILMSRAAGGKKFSKLDVKRVYFGNWLRDYSQAVDVGTVKYVSAEAIRLILWVLGFMSFGYGTKEFEVTMDRLGCYRPEEHIDNPKDYADNIDARQYDRRLRGPVDERRELSVNPQTGLKNYIASESIGITTSAGLVRKLFGRSVQLGRQYGRSKNKADLYEALRLLGTGCHCLEDYSAHSNYTELALIELGERGIFPHVGRQTQINLPGVRQPVFPIVTGTFGGTDFLYSVIGEFSDKATQSEIQELQGTIQQSQGSAQNTSILHDLLNQVPSGLFGGSNPAGKVDELQMNSQAAQMQNTHITPRQPEEWTKQLQAISKQIYPILEWHDEIMQSINEFIEKIPILPDLIEQLQEQVNVFVFTLLAPIILPIIDQVKTELSTGSSEIIQSSQDKQFIVFHDDRCSDPTHSMLSKDHFSTFLNEVAGKVASQVLKWVVPQIIACWDDERIDVDRTLTRIVNGVFHHPALRDRGDDGAIDGRRLMFGVMQQWWSQKDEQERAMLRDRLSRSGVEQGRNHKDGVQDVGHGCGKPLGMPNVTTARTSGAHGGPILGTILGDISSALEGESQYDPGSTGVRPSGGKSAASFGGFNEGSVSGGGLGSVVGVLAGGLGGGLLGEAFEGSNVQKNTYQRQNYGDDGSYTRTYTETGYTRPQPDNEQQRYGQGEWSQTVYTDGRQRQEYQRYEQGDRGGYGNRVIVEDRPTFGGGYEETRETRYEKPGGVWESETRREELNARGEVLEESRPYRQQGHGGYKRDTDREEFVDERTEIRETYSDQSLPRREYVDETRYEEGRPVDDDFERERFEGRRRPTFQQEFKPERPPYDERYYEHVDEVVERREGFGGREQYEEEEVAREDFDDGRGYERNEEFEERREYDDY